MVALAMNVEGIASVLIGVLVGYWGVKHFAMAGKPV